MDKDERASVGVSKAISTKYTKHVCNWKVINEFLIPLDVDIWRNELFIKRVFAPHDDAESKTKEEVFE